jgi:hypothetical protein
MRTSRATESVSRLKARFAGTRLTPEDWLAFRLVFAGDVDAILNRHGLELERAIAVGTKGDSSVDLTRVPQEQWPLHAIRLARDNAKKAVGVDAQLQLRYDALQKTISQQESSLRKLEADIASANGAAERRAIQSAARRDAYVAVFETIVREEEVLRGLYAPLETALSKASGALAKLRFEVQRKIDTPDWLDQGESMLDLRRDSAFRGQGTLERAASERLIPAWKTGSRRSRV